MTKINNIEEVHTPPTIGGFATHVEETTVFLEDFIPVEPVPLSRPRVVKDKYGRRAVYLSKRSEEAKVLCGRYLRSRLRGKPPIPKSALIFVELDFHILSARRMDIDNLQKLIFDAGNAIVWEDDSSIIGVYAMLYRKSSFEGTGIRVSVMGSH